MQTDQLTVGGRAFTTARAALRALGRFEALAMMLALVGVTLLTGVSVALRDLFAISLVWAQEISLLMFHVLVFSGAGLVYKARAYITMDFVFRALPSGAQQALMFATWVVAALFPLAVLWQGLGLYSRQITTMTYILELPRFFFTVPLLFGTVSLFLTNAFYAWASGLYLLDRMPGDGVAGFEELTTILPGPRASR